MLDDVGQRFLNDTEYGCGDLVGERSFDQLGDIERNGYRVVNSDIFDEAFERRGQS